MKRPSARQATIYGTALLVAAAVVATVTIIIPGHHSEAGGPQPTGHGPGFVARMNDTFHEFGKQSTPIPCDPQSPNPEDLCFPPDGIPNAEALRSPNRMILSVI